MPPVSRDKARRAGAAARARQSSSDELATIKEEIAALRSITDPGLAFIPMEPLLGELLVRIKRWMKVDTAYVALLASDGLELVVRARAGRLAPRVGLSVAVGSQLLARVVARRTAMDSGARGRVFDTPLLPAGSAALAAPLIVEGKPLGVVVVARPGPHAYRQHDFHLLETMASQAAVVFERSRLIADLERAAHDLELRVERRTAELADANEDLRMFAAAASHDLKAPLRTIAAMSRALREDNTDVLSEPALELLSSMERAGIRAWDLVHGLLEFARLRRLDRNLERVDLDEVTAEVVAAVDEAPSARGRSREARVVVTGRLGQVLGTRAAVTSILTNLVSNAVKFVTPGERPRVRISSRRVGERVRVTVADHGIGIDSAEYERVFEPFHRLHGVDDYSGSGLGLASVRRAVEKMGGRLGVDSRPGAGSRFWFELPAVPPRA